MADDESVASATRWLSERGAGKIEHPGGTLLDHLLRVRLQLSDWGASQDVQMAGLCHAAYGTDGFSPVLLPVSERPVLTSLIGDRAEHFVYRYDSCDRAATYPQLGTDDVVITDRFTGAPVSCDQETLRAFAEITAANELDVLRHNAEIEARYGDQLRQLVERMQGLLSPAALRDWRATAA